MNGPGISYQEQDGSGTRGWTRQLADLYGVAFAGPPWRETHADVLRFLRRFAWQSTVPTFRCILAVADDELLGACYGYSLTGPFPPDEPFYQQLLTQIDAGLIDRHLRGTYEIAELMVHPDAQRHGVGTTLLTDMLTNCRQAWLCVHRDSHARRLYERAGFRHLAPLTAARNQPLDLMTWTAAT
ncbi:GNAT family N-acetyltransferase [Frankia sp. CiP3]|uniref:GNAT family N-acetyltransferase n=1 Tax=Frankia sp. CiP3 TaxID=2880971 RepID=UPI001EF3F650|nr:GNAT family N-acetyltransferase [Frankia sp. CiP3]